jgi:hypothetical protein
MKSIGSAFVVLFLICAENQLFAADTRKGAGTDALTAAAVLMLRKLPPGQIWVDGGDAKAWFIKSAKGADMEYPDMQIWQRAFSRALKAAQSVLEHPHWPSRRARRLSLFLKDRLQVLPQP